MGSPEELSGFQEAVMNCSGKWQWLPKRKPNIKAVSLQHFLYSLYYPNCPTSHQELSHLIINLVQFAEDVISIFVMHFISDNRAARQP